MNRRVSLEAIKSEGEQQVEEEDAAASVQAAAHAEPLTLLAVFKLHLDMLVWLQLCNSQGVALFSFVRLPPRAPRPFAGAPLHDMSLTHAERLRAVGCGLKGKLVRLLSLGVGCHFEPQRNRSACHQMMQSSARRVAAGLAAAVLQKVVKESERLLVAGQYAAAAAQLQRAIDLGHLPSRAHLADLLLHAREGFATDADRAFALAEEGARFGCHHCQGELAMCYRHHTSHGDRAQDAAHSLALACASADKGSKYGQKALGDAYTMRRLEGDHSAAVAQYRLAAAQGYDEAQCSLGFLIGHGVGVALDQVEALRWYALAAAQGHAAALYNVGLCLERGWGVAEDGQQAVGWYVTRARAVLLHAADARAAQVRARRRNGSHRRCPQAEVAWRVTC